MYKKFIINLFIISACIFALAGFASAQTDSQLKITSVEKKAFWDSSLYLEGTSAPNANILLSVIDEGGNFSYIVKIAADSNGKWYKKLDQPFKSGTYDVQVIAFGENGVTERPVDFGTIDIFGTFDVLIAVFSVLVIILLAGFLAIWYASKSAEVKRYRRILASQNDIVASYNVLKKDVDEAMHGLSAESEKDWRVHEVKYLLERISVNLEKVNKYVLQGVGVIGKYDIVSKVDNLFKFKNKNLKN